MSQKRKIRDHHVIARNEKRGEEKREGRLRRERCER